LNPQEIILEHNVGQDTTQHNSVPGTSIVVLYPQVEVTSVQLGATIQAAPPPVLQIIRLPSGNVVPAGHDITKLLIASGDAIHQSAGPAVTPIVFIDSY
jgi:hypothetical protein